MALPGIAPYAQPSLADLPKPRGAWQPSRDRMAVLVHDMQRYFCRPFPDTVLDPVTANIARLIQSARAAGVPVFYTAQKGNQFRPDRGLQADLWGPGMQATPEHEEVLPALAPAEGDIVLVKHRYSAFQRSNLETLMRARGRDQLMICGVYAHIGCLATAVEAFQRDIETFAVADAQADFSRNKLDLAMGWIAATCGIPMMTDQAVATFAQVAECA
ncbi:isochorismatase family protein [Paracoccus shanxieyensis]|uniref:Isochorismatase family protein n=1 Tax=Paracoccus shanxieyensis TaxID=2675752 RepID=A0A6L6J589_9RHOB|nr:isochorismatase family protein [Paracoccus shanxieyensis]MTH65874.1 isochorismatase family protein [Paracoccus shanxieyensis]MTH89217.1 isochorismatase family protein [Paracoccus shanxieyensis]